MTSTNTNSIFVGIEDTTPQNEQFNTVREFDENEEGFIDVDMNDMSNVWSDQMSDDQNSMVEELDIREEDQGGENDEKDLQQLEMSPLLLNKVNDDINHEEGNVIHSEMDEPMSSQLEANNINNDLPPPPSSPKSILPRQAMQIMRSRRVKSGDTSDYDDADNDKHRKRFSCLKKKRSRDGGEYERIDNTQYTGLDASTNSRTESETSTVSGGAAAAMGCGKMRRFCQESSKQVLRTTVSVMNFLAKVLLWGSFVAMIIGVVWYSRELKNRGHEPHLIAWFSAGAFVLLGFPISMCGIIMHLKNYYQPNVQCYVVRILWMVPIYSIESWLCLRFHELAIYIETLRDVYESYVLYSFFQFLIEVLGGEEALVLMLKDKSPTRGAHIWGLGYCIKPWAMGQPVSRRVSYTPDKMARMGHNNSFATNNNGGQNNGSVSPRGVPIKKVEWMSPFFVKCKFGVLQYVLLKFVSSIFVMVLEMSDLYKEGDFTPRGGYLYICILTNLSQCWALYCLVLFYYALKNELGPIRPIGKFLSVKALVFFTWWQSLGISIFFQMGMIPKYTAFSTGRDWSSDDVAKGLQDWLICIERFCFAIIHTFVFPHTDYLKPLGVMKQRADMTPHGVRRLGRKGRHGYRRGDDRSACSKSSGEHELGGFDLELGSVDTAVGLGKTSTVDEQSDKDSTGSGGIANGVGEPPRHERQGFVRALVDSTLPRDVLDESVGIFKGKFNDEKKTLLHHAATSDEYDLFSKSSKRRKAKFSRSRQQGGAVSSSRKMKEGVSAGVPNSVLLND